MASFNYGTNVAASGSELGARLYGPGVVQVDLGKNNGDLIRSGDATLARSVYWLNAVPGERGTPTATLSMAGTPVPNHYPFVGYASAPNLVCRDTSTSSVGQPKAAGTPIIGAPLQVPSYFGSEGWKFDATDYIKTVVANVDGARMGCIADLTLAGVGASVALVGSYIGSDRYIADRGAINEGSARATYVGIVQMAVTGENTVDFSSGYISLGSVAPAAAKVAMEAAANGDPWIQGLQTIRVTTAGGVTAKQYLSRFPFFQFQFNRADFPLDFVESFHWVA